MRKKIFQKICFVLVCGFTVSVYPGNYPFNNLGAKCWLNATMQCMFKLKPLSDVLLKYKPEDIKLSDEELKGLNKQEQKSRKAGVSVLQSYIRFNNFINAPEKKGKVFSDEPLKEYQEPLANKVFKIFHKEGFACARLFLESFLGSLCRKDFAWKDEVSSLFKITIKSESQKCSLCWSESPGTEEVCCFLYGFLSSKFQEDEWLSANLVASDLSVFCKSCSQFGIKGRLPLVNSPKILIVSIPGPNKEGIFPLSFNLKPYLLSEQDVFYDLTGVVCGNEFRNHYYAYAKDFDTGQWYHFNSLDGVFIPDQEVVTMVPGVAAGTKVDVEKVQMVSDDEMQKIANKERDGKNYPEILFYVRRDAPVCLDQVERLKLSLDTLKMNLVILAKRLAQVKEELGPGKC